MHAAQLLDASADACTGPGQIAIRLPFDSARREQTVYPIEESRTEAQQGG